MNHVKIGKYISYLLRHHPEDGLLEMDYHGYVKVDDLIGVLKEKYSGFTKKDLDTIVETNNKQRYSYNKDQSLIRANQGHSILVDVELEEKIPPQILYHGTALKYKESIEKQGIKKQDRLYVHLSSDYETAIKVGQRHGKPVVFQIEAKKMWQDGYHFYLSKNHVWQIKYVPSQYLQVSTLHAEDQSLYHSTENTLKAHWPQ